MGETPGKMYALATLLTLLAVVAVLLRFHARKIQKAILTWDDYLITVALVSHSTSDASSAHRLTKVEPVLHNRYSAVYVRWLVNELNSVVGSGLIARYRDCTRGSGTTHKD